MIISALGKKSKKPPPLPLILPSQLLPGLEQDNAMMQQPMAMDEAQPMDEG